MARFFKYKSVAELEAENARLGIDLRFTDDLAPLFVPISVGSRTAGNRWCIQPMEGCDGELDGTPGELTFRRYTRFGAGGAKIIWGEACAVNLSARANPRQIALNESTKSAFARIVADCRKAHRDANETDADLLIGLQLTHSGRYSHPRPIIATHDPILDPRTVANKATGEVVTPDYPLITDDELKRLVDDYATTAELAVGVGFDFLDVKQCHHYLLNELLGARNRPGPYGGSFENRTRCAREAIQAVRAAVPANIVIASRLNVYDGIPFHKAANDDGAPDPHALPLANGWGMSETDPFAVDLTEPLKWIAEMRATPTRSRTTVGRSSTHRWTATSRQSIRSRAWTGTSAQPKPFSGPSRTFRSSAPATATCKSFCHKPRPRTSATAA
jgi:2,4-dienoyl-CoA reductase-like NADH-dependent reductase (Old Yellow Enzyme family)